MGMMKGRLNFLMTKSFDVFTFLQPICFGKAGQRPAGGDKKIHTTTRKFSQYKGAQPALKKLPDVCFALGPGKCKGNPRPLLT